MPESTYYHGNAQLDWKLRRGNDWPNRPVVAFSINIVEPACMMYMARLQAVVTPGTSSPLKLLHPP